MSPWSFLSRSRSALLDAAIVAGLAGLALFGSGRGAAAARRNRKAARATIETWEGEGGNIVPPQPSDAAIAGPPAAASAGIVSGHQPHTPARA